MHPQKKKKIIIGFAKGVYNNNTLFLEPRSPWLWPIGAFLTRFIHMVESPKNSEIVII
jgi:hypothetical protein